MRARLSQRRASSDALSQFCLSKFSLRAPSATPAGLKEMPNTRLFVFDSHRPLDLRNLDDNNSSVLVFRDVNELTPEGDGPLPVLDDDKPSGSGSSSDDDDGDGDEEDEEEGAKSPAFLARPRGRGGLVNLSAGAISSPRRATPDSPYRLSVPPRRARRPEAARRGSWGGPPHGRPQKGKAAKGAPPAVLPPAHTLLPPHFPRRRPPQPPRTPIHLLLLSRRHRPTPPPPHSARGGPPPTHRVLQPRLLLRPPRRLPPLRRRPPAQERRAGPPRASVVRHRGAHRPGAGRRRGALEP